MEAPIDQYKKLVTIDEISSLAYDTLFTKYIIENKWGENKLTDIDSTDQENVVAKLNGGFPIPGCMYTFIYKPSKDDLINFKYGNKIKSYTDYVPIIFCTGISKGQFSGINLNALPKSERLSFLQTYYSTYKEFFANVESLAQNNKIAINKQYLKLALSQKGQDAINFFSTSAKSNFNYGYRKYSLHKVDRLRMIEYSEWNYLPFFDPKHAFKLMNQMEIHKQYYRS